MIKSLIKWYHSHLSHRLNTAFIAFVVITLGIAMSIAIYYVKTETVASYQLSVHRQLTLVDASLQQYVDNIKANTMTLAEMPLVKLADSSITTYVNQSGPNGLVPMEPWKGSLLEQDLYELLGVFQKSQPSIKNASIGVAANGGFIKHPASPRFDGYDSRQRSWYQSAISQPNQVVVSGIYTTSTQEKVIVSAKAILNQRQEIAGVVTLDFDLSFLSETIKNIVIGQNGYVVLCDSAGTILAHPNQNNNFGLHPKHADLIGKPITNLGFTSLVTTSDETTSMLSGTFKINDLNIDVIPASIPSLGLYYVVVIPAKEYTQSAFRIASQLFLAIIPISLVAILAGTYLTHRIVKPLTQLKVWAASLTKGHLNQRIELNRIDEIGQLTTQFNTMADVLQRAQNHLEDQVAQRTLDLYESNEELSATNEELTDTLALLNETQNHLIQSEKLSGLGRMVSGIAHEMNTPLGIAITMASYFDLLLEEEPLPLERIKETNATLQRNLKRTSLLIENFKQVAIDQTASTKRTFNLYQYIAELLETYLFDARFSKVNISWTCDTTLELNSYPGSLGIIVVQWLENAIQHAFNNHPSPKISISAYVEKNHCLLIYEDNGIGMNEESKKRLFEPFSTTKRIEGSTGLGLFVIYNIVTLQLEGSIELINPEEQGPGVSFTIKFPLKD